MESRDGSGEAAGRTKIYVLAALGLSVAVYFLKKRPQGDGDWEQFGRIWPSRQGKLADPGVTAAELAAVKTVVAGRKAADIEVTLVLFYNEGDTDQQQALGYLKDILSEYPVGGCQVTVKERNIGSTGVKIGEIREAQEALLREAAEFAALSACDDVEVYVNATSGVRSVNLALHQIAVMFSLPVLINPDMEPGVGNQKDAVEVPAPPLTLDAAATLRMVDAAYLAASSGTDGAEVAKELSVAPLVKSAGGGSVERSALADLLEQQAATKRKPPVHSAGAALLRRHARSIGRTDPVRADKVRSMAEQLEDHVEKWVEQRLWSLNKVPEMVLHDDRHVERVDHLSSMLAEPLLRTGKIHEDDVFILSCAAWLHDWGHIGAVVDGKPLVHPVDVREFHGIITKQLLEDSPDIHGLPKEAAVKVGALAAHHQGWTALDDGSRVSDDRLDPEGRDTLEDCGDGADCPEHDPGFEKRYPKLTSVGHDPSEMEPDQMRLLTAILRVADAADIGIHRVPGGRKSLEANRRNYARLIAGLEMQEMAALAANGTITETTKENVGNLLTKLLEDMDFKTLIKGLEKLRDGIGEGREEDTRFVDRTIGYMCQVQNQFRYDEKHERVMIVRFELVPQPAGGWDYRALVTPASGQDPADAVRDVDCDIRRELKPVELKKDADLTHDKVREGVSAFVESPVKKVLEAAGLFYLGAEEANQ